MPDKVVDIKLGRGIGTAGIWIGVGLIGLHDTAGWSVGVAICAVIATFFVWAAD